MIYNKTTTFSEKHIKININNKIYIKSENIVEILYTSYIPKNVAVQLPGP
tara:strand:- start:1572 stop:1721 length:150 start_codon:yes stop_codon:yes gene_type:complete